MGFKILKRELNSSKILNICLIIVPPILYFLSYGVYKFIDSNVMTSDFMSKIIGIFFFILVFATVVVIFCVPYFIIGYTIFKFWRNAFGKNGYYMNLLPLKAGSLLGAAVIEGIVMIILYSLVLLGIAAHNLKIFDSVTKIGVSAGVFFLLSIILTLVGIIYAVILANRDKYQKSNVAYTFLFAFLLYVVNQIITLITVVVDVLLAKDPYIEKIIVEYLPVTTIFVVIQIAFCLVHSTYLINRKTSIK